MALHWHAYAYDGPSRPHEQLGESLTSQEPPAELARWLLKDPDLVRHTFLAPDPALDWLSVQAQEWGYGSGCVPLGARIEYSGQMMKLPMDICWAWYTESAYALRVLICCPKPGYPCPSQVARYAAPNPPLAAPAVPLNRARS